VNSKKINRAHWKKTAKKRGDSGTRYNQKSNSESKGEKEKTTGLELWVVIGV